jgi:hypothetical protein
MPTTIYQIRGQYIFCSLERVTALGARTLSQQENGSQLLLNICCVEEL